MPVSSTKHWEDTLTAFTITLANLASSAAKVGRQSTLVATADAFGRRPTAMIISVFLTQGTDPVGSKAAYIHLLRSDGHGSTPTRTDNAGASDAALTVLNAPLIGVLQNKAAPATGDVLADTFVVLGPFPAAVGVAIWHDTGVNLKNAAADQRVRYAFLYPESRW